MEALDIVEKESNYRSYGGIGKNFSEREKSAFKAPDRKEEDDLVARFQKTGDKQIHARLFEIRKSTISVWARKYAWVCDSEDDLFSELSMVWLRCIKKYKYEADVRPVRTKEGHLVKDENDNVKTVFKRTPFNTFIFTAFRNHIFNIIKKKYSKKRLDDKGNPIELGMHSLDYEYGDDCEGASLHEMIEDKSKTNKHLEQIGGDWIIDEISQGDKTIQDVLRNFLNNGQIQDIKSACMLKSGFLKLRKRDRDILISGGMKAHQHLKKMIVKSGRNESEFQISNYQIYPQKVVFEIIVKDDLLSKKVSMAIKKAKRKLMGKF